MTQFATLPIAERRLLIEQVATRLGIVPVIVEKDFWVCWSLGRIFGVEGTAFRSAAACHAAPARRGVPE